MAEEGMEKTPNDLIHIGKPIYMDVERFFKQLELLAQFSYVESPEILSIVALAVPTYHCKSDEDKIPISEDNHEALMKESAITRESIRQSAYYGKKA